MEKTKNLPRVTSQKGVRTAVHPIHRRYRTHHLDLDRSRIKGKWYVDWMPASQKSTTGVTDAWMYTNGHFTEVFPTQTKSNIDAACTLKDFCQDVGLLKHIKSNQVSKLCNQNSKLPALTK